MDFGKVLNEEKNDFLIADKVVNVINKFNISIDRTMLACGVNLNFKIWRLKEKTFSENQRTSLNFQ